MQFSVIAIPEAPPKILGSAATRVGRNEVERRTEMGEERQTPRTGGLTDGGKLEPLVPATWTTRSRPSLSPGSHSHSCLRDQLVHREGPTVRIRFPPARSLLRTSLSRAADPGEEVDPGGALEAEGAADRPLAGAAVSGAPSGRPGKTVTESPAEERGRYRSQGRLSSWFVRLCVKSGRFVTSGRSVAPLMPQRALRCAGR